MDGEYEALKIDGFDLGGGKRVQGWESAQKWHGFGHRQKCQEAQTKVLSVLLRKSLKNLYKAVPHRAREPAAFSRKREPTLGPPVLRKTQSGRYISLIGVRALVSWRSFLLESPGGF